MSHQLVRFLSSCIKGNRIVNLEVFGEGDKKSQIIMRPDKPNAPQYIMDITPAIQELGYKPKYNYLEMLRDFKREMQYAENVGR